MRDSVSINIFGDFVPLNRGIDTIKKNVAISDDIVDIIRTSDYNIVNLECPVVKSNKAKPIIKDGPNLKCSENTVAYLKNIGFNLFTFANNHFKDYGISGIKDTFKACRENKISWVGAGLNLQEASKPIIIEIKRIRIGIVNICENESSISTDSEAGSNPIDLISNYYDIYNLKELVDKVILIIHGGVEHYRLPSPRMKKMCHFFADIGVSAIICHHTHCYSGYEEYNNVPIFYGLGNFFFDRPNKLGYLWNTGFFVQLQLKDDRIDYCLKPYYQCMDQAQVRMMCEKEKENFYIEISQLNRIINNDDSLREEYENWFNSRYRSYISTTMTWGGRILRALYRKKLIPASMSPKNAALLLNYIRCESHHDLLIKSLEKFVNK